MVNVFSGFVIESSARKVQAMFAEAVRLVFADPTRRGGDDEGKHRPVRQVTWAH